MPASRNRMLFLTCFAFTLLAAGAMASPAIAWQFRDVTPPQLRTISDEQESAPGQDLVRLQANSIVEKAASHEVGATESEGPEEDAEEVENRPIQFNDIAAGITSAQELENKWGQPAKISEGDGHAIWKYKIEPFRQVNVTVVDDVVASVLLYLKEPLEPAEVAAEMGLESFRPVPIPDELGRVLGQAYPERGVMLSLIGDLDQLKVKRIQLEPISSELFQLRAEYDFQRQYQRALKDLDVALRLDPRNARAHWWRAEVLATVGKFKSALEAAQSAVQLNPADHRYRLTEARLLAANGNRYGALEVVSAVLETEDLSAHLRALAKYQLGNLTATGPTRSFKDATKHHMEAIEIAAPLADEQRFAVRRLAKQVLIDAHLAIALDIAKGDYQEKRKVIPKWISRAGTLTEELIAREQGDPLLRLRVLRTQLAASADLNGAFDATKAVETAMKFGQQIIDNEQDPLSKSRARWELGHLMFEAMRTVRLHRKTGSALTHADSAITLLEKSAPQRQSTPEQKYLIARLYFLIGTLHAVQMKDHDEAVAWYVKAEPLLTNHLDAGELADAGIQGERFVSMGVSYWENGKHQKAIDLTEKGLQVIQQAVDDGQIKSDTLAVPYGNLATMHRYLGNASQAEKYASLATKMNSPSRPAATRR